MSEKETLRIAAVADIHVKKSGQGTMQPLFAEITEAADVLLLCGDLTIIKDFVHQAINESLKLEAALHRLRTPQKIAVLHYSPIQATVVGEPPEIIAFLGSSRLEEPIDRYRVTAVFHGHAHRGTAEGRTKGNGPVYNVAMPVLSAAFPDRAPFRLVEVAVHGEVAFAR